MNRLVDYFERDRCDMVRLCWVLRNRAKQRYLSLGRGSGSTSCVPVCQPVRMSRTCPRRGNVLRMNDTIPKIHNRSAIKYRRVTCRAPARAILCAQNFFSSFSHTRQNSRWTSHDTATIVRQIRQTRHELQLYKFQVFWYSRATVVAAAHSDAQLSVTWPGMEIWFYEPYSFQSFLFCF